MKYVINWVCNSTDQSGRTSFSMSYKAALGLCNHLNSAYPTRTYKPIPATSGHLADTGTEPQPTTQRQLS